MSKIVLNATTCDLISNLKLDDIKMLERIDSPALAIRDDNGHCLFKVMTGCESAVCADGIMFGRKDLEGNAVVTMNIDTTLDRNDLFNAIYDKVGVAKAKLDEVEAKAIEAVATENAAKAAFVADLAGEPATQE